MFNPHIKFKMSTITCNEEMKGNAKCKNSCFEPHFGGIRGNVQETSMARCKVHLIQSAAFHKCKSYILCLEFAYKILIFAVLERRLLQ